MPESRRRPADPRPDSYSGRWDDLDFGGHVVETAHGLTRALEHHVRHSPTGFAWGYCGSGPADLALSILHRHLDAEPHPILYQRFKEDLVSRWPSHGSWTIEAREIDRWMASLDPFLAAGAMVCEGPACSQPAGVRCDQCERPLCGDHYRTLPPEHPAGESVLCLAGEGCQTYPGQPTQERRTRHDS